MLLYVEKESSQEQIYQFAKEMGAKWIVVNTEHYRGNNKGYYQSVKRFKDSNVFHWNNEAEDRGATSVYVTDIDIPAAVAARIELIREMNSENWKLVDFLNKVNDKYPIQSIDGRWGTKNPKRLEIESKLKARREAIKKAHADHEANVGKIKNKLMDTDFVSSSYIELSL